MVLKNDALRRKEHNAIRQSVGYYDFTHQLLEVRGKDAAAFLDGLFVNAIAATGNGHAKYTTMLNEEGKIIDDVIVFRVAEDWFQISTLYINELIAWLDAHKGNSEVSYRDITGENTMYAIQGPNSRTLLNRILKNPVDGLTFYSFADNKVGDMVVSVARSGFTGELGYELYCDPAVKCDIEHVLVDAGQDLGLTKITTDVIIGSLPREKGYVLMQDVGGHNPYEVGFGWSVAKNKDYIGRAATEAIAAEGANVHLLGFELLEDAELELGVPVVVNGEEVGKVSSFTYGYTCEKYIGYALLPMTCNPGDEALVGGVKAKLTDRVWYDKENLRTRGA